MFAILSVVGITGVEILQKQNAQNKELFRNFSKRYKSDIHSVRNVGSDDLNNVHHS